LILTALVVLAIPNLALAQSAAPDLSGIWMMEAGMNAGAEARRFSPEEPPLQPWALEKYRAAREGIDPSQGGRNELDPSYFCFPPGAARSMLMPSAFEIVQRPNQVYLLFEFNSGTRRIYMDGRGHPEGADPTWMGHSTGKWEGDTLLVETVGLREETWLDRFGTPHSDALRISERFRRLNRNTLEVEFWFEDSKAFTKPWGGKKVYASQGPTEMTEYILCEEHLEMGTVRGKTPEAP
jgi:hypothetical protein